MKFCFGLICFVLMAVSLNAAPAKTKKHQTQTAQTENNRILEVQIWLDRKNYSPGEIDGMLGKNMKNALAAYEEHNQLPVGEKLDDELLALLREDGIEPITNYTITEEDADGPYADKIPEDYMEQSKLQSLGFTSELEALGEKFHCSPQLLKKLNSGSDFAAGSAIRVPNVSYAERLSQSKQDKVQPVSGKKQQTQSNPANALSVIVSKDKSQLMVKDSTDKTIFIAPITAGSDEYPYPFGTWKIKGVSWNPHFAYDPSLFKDAPEKDIRAKLPPGPNSPVGVVWIDITAPHYGIHGTPDPGRIGYSESHGCIRLTNWDAVKLANLVKVGTPVNFE